MLEQDVHRPRRGVEDVDERERCGDGRRERREVEDRPEEAHAAPCAREHRGDAEGEEDLQRDHDRDDPEGVLHRLSDLGVLGEEVPVVRGTDPLRRRQQVVVRERQVDAHHERVTEEDREADQPRRHQEQDEATSTPGRLSLRPRPVDRLGADRRNGYPGHLERGARAKPARPEVGTAAAVTTLTITALRPPVPASVGRRSACRASSGRPAGRLRDRPDT